MANNDTLKFKAKTGFLFAAIAFHAAVLSSIPLFVMDNSYENSVALKWMFGVLLFFILSFTFAVYLRTFYTIDKDQKQLGVYFIFKVKTLKLQDIAAIEKAGSPTSGARFALSSDDGLIIKEGKYDSFFINPKDKKEFLKTLERLKS